LENLIRMIKGCIGKEPKYQRLVYDRYRRFASRVVFRYIYHYEKVRDVVTDGFVKAFHHFHQFRMEEDKDPEALLKAWLKRIMINCSIDELRRGSMLPEIGDMSDAVWELADKSGGADQALLYKELITVIKELPPHYRVVFNLYVLDGYNHSQIADLLHISVSTSRSGLTRARELLQTRIKKMEEEKICRM
jgi:RNA polymerase sigma factor (sigma-70 family)